MRAGLWQIILVIVLVMILFGHNKIPGMMKNLAGGIKTFKKELNEDDKKSAPKKAPAKKSVKKAAAKPVAKKTPAKKKTSKK